MLLEEYVADRVRASETAAHIRELELLRVIRAADDGQGGDGAKATRRSDAPGEARETGWSARRSAARARKAERVEARAARTSAIPAVPRSSTLQPSTTKSSTTQPGTLQPSTTQPSTLQPSTTEPSTLQSSTTQPDAVSRQAEREFQHLAR